MKLLLNIYIPAIGQQYDILVPDSLRVKNVISLVAGTVEQLSNHLYISSGEECLCSVEKNIRFRTNTALEKYGIQNGDHLVLI